MRCLLAAASAAALTSLASSASAQTNLPPVANGTIPNLTAKPTTGATRILGLANFFRDPEQDIVLRTSLGDIPITLYSDSLVANTVSNFLAYVDANRFSISFVHRIATTNPDGLAVVQGGGFTFDNGNYGQVTGNAPIALQAGFSNARGTIAMARTSDPNSATSQWYLNQTPNTFLDNQYAVFGRINSAAGLAVMDAIYALPTYSYGITIGNQQPLQKFPMRNYSSGLPTAANLIFAPIQRSSRPFQGFTAGSNAPGIVTATGDATGVNLTFAGGTGPATVTVNATDADGATGGANAFTVTVSNTPPQANLVNISTRAFVGDGDNVLIGGFVVRGSNKRVLVRSLGPSLIPFGVANAISDPNITLQSGATVIASNDNWKATQQADIQATGFAPTNDVESALIADLAPGSYTPIVRGTGGVTGVSIVEVYELSPNETPQLINISTRGRVGTGNNVMIGGFVVGGTTPKRVLVRTLGPTLSQFGVTGALADPSIELNSGGQAIATNDDWQLAPGGGANPDAAAITASGFAPPNNKECAIIATLAPGSYTAIVRGVGDTEGVALVEVYDLD